MLHDPETDAEPDPWTVSPGWNGRLICTFGGGCVNGWFRQGDRTGGVTDVWMLGQGYAVASAMTIGAVSVLRTVGRFVR